MLHAEGWHPNDQRVWTLPLQPHRLGAPKGTSPSLLCCFSRRAPSLPSCTSELRTIL